MSSFELPHTRGCLVCGRDNAQGLRLDLHVDESSGVVTCALVPSSRHMGFDGIIHGGLLATVLDEAMVWAATWGAKRFCVCGEMTVRFRRIALIGQPLRVEAKVTSHRSRLIETEGTIRDDGGTRLVEASGKYVPVTPERNRQYLATLIDESSTAQAAKALRDNA